MNNKLTCKHVYKTAVYPVQMKDGSARMMKFKACMGCGKFVPLDATAVGDDGRDVRMWTRKKRR